MVVAERGDMMNGSNMEGKAMSCDLALAQARAKLVGKLGEMFANGKADLELLTLVTQLFGVEDRCLRSKGQ